MCFFVTSGIIRKYEISQVFFRADLVFTLNTELKDEWLEKQIRIEALRQLSNGILQGLIQ